MIEETVLLTAQIETLSEPGEIRALADEARAQGRVALDTEFMWERTYAPELCLLQVATADRIVLLDPIDGAPIEPIAELVSDPAVELIMHAPSADLLLFALRADARPTNIFDTQLAAGFVGLGISTAYDRLVESVLRVKLEHSATFTDWKRRPLSETQVAYAADDVRYLGALADELIARLERLGRTSWARDELARRYGDPAALMPDPERAFQRVGRRGRLSGRQLSVLRELAAWREREARRRDTPTGWLLKDPSLVELARAQPLDPAALRRVRGVGSMGAQETQELLAAVARGIEAEPLPSPREPSGEVARRSAVAAALAAVLVRARCEDARIAPELVATRGDLEEFSRAALTGGVEGQSLASGWRRDLVGAELEELLAGRIAIAADPGPSVARLLDASPGDAAPG